jgi:hypothetical protein
MEAIVVTLVQQVVSTPTFRGHSGVLGGLWPCLTHAMCVSPLCSYHCYMHRKHLTHSYSCAWKPLLPPWCSRSCQPMGGGSMTMFDPCNLCITIVYLPWKHASKASHTLINTLVNGSYCFHPGAAGHVYPEIPGFRGGLWPCLTHAMCVSPLCIYHGHMHPKHLQILAGWWEDNTGPLSWPGRIISFSNLFSI